MVIIIIKLKTIEDFNVEIDKEVEGMIEKKTNSFSQIRMKTIMLGVNH